MADFRRVVTALAVLALMMGFGATANAQITTPAFACTAQAAVPPLVRAEGMTELVGDIVLNCQGGFAIPDGNPVPTANFQVFFGPSPLTVTSRIVGTGNLSEALLLVDEPGTSLNPSAILTGAPLTGCAAPCPAGTGTPNAYQGIVSGNSVTFLGVPINPPGTAAGTGAPLTRIFRITNVRVNASAIGANAGFLGSQVSAFTSISGSTSVPVNNPLQTVGYVLPGLNFSTSSSGTRLLQCNTNSALATNLQFAEGFATAFKTQYTTVTGATQTIPGAIYNTESGLVVNPFPAPGGSAKIGLADFGTRLKAVFQNIPKGSTIWVGTQAMIGTSGTVGAKLISGSEGSANSTVNNPATATASTSSSAPGGTTPTFALTADANGTATAVWEVTTANPLSVDTYVVPVYVTSSPSVGTNLPQTGVQATVYGSFAPTPADAATATAWASASSTAPIPRFNTPTIKPANVVFIDLCRMTLLFPFVTGFGGFDTGLAIANTTKDTGVYDTVVNGTTVAGTTTANQDGTCKLFFFGTGAPSAYTTPTITSGTVWVDTVTNGQTLGGANFYGYVIARCNFLYAHGFAFVQSTVGYTPSTAAMGYLALVLNRYETTGEGLNQ